MGSAQNLLRNAVIVDTETTGLGREVGIHELAIFDLDKQEVYEYLLKPQLVRAKFRNEMQDAAKLASTSMDEFHIVEGIRTWQDLITAQAAIEGGKTDTWDDVMQHLKYNNRFLYDALKSGKYPHLMGAPDSPQVLEERRRKLGSDIRAVLGQRITMQEVLDPEGQVLQKLRGKTIWIANANFEAKVLGSQISGMIDAGIDTGIRRMMETHNPHSRDPLYVTGVEVNRARAFAQQTGDWTQVWKAYIDNPVKPGETAVRDIQDVVRAFMSYGKKLGILNTKDQYFGTAIDVVSKLFGSIEEDPDIANAIFRFDEVHRAAEDVAKSENYVLRRAVKYTSALQEVYEGTEVGQELLQKAARGEGELAQAAKYFARLEYIAGDIQEQNLVKRMVRAARDLHREGESYQIVGMDPIPITSKQKVPGSERLVEVERVKHYRKPFTGLDDIARFIDDNASYSEAKVTAAQMAERIEAHLSGQGDIEKALTEFEEENTTAMYQGKRMSRVAAKLRAEEDIIRTLDRRNLGKAVTAARMRPVKEGMIDAVSSISVKSLGRGAAAAGIAVAAMGAMWSMVDGNPQPGRAKPSIVSYDYYEWQRRQEEFYDMKRQNRNPGMQEEGLAGMRRRHFTDFGSPYRGPMASQYVFIDQELQREREKWMREQYGAQHYDPVHGLFGALGPFKRLNMSGRAGYSYLQEGTALDSQSYKGLRGTGYMAINLSDGSWKMSVEDADTITVQRGGVRGAIASFFNMNKRYSFRLAGIDSTEVSHGPNSAQPYAEQAKSAMEQMLSGKDIQLVYDPSQTTYGRMMGVVYADGRNVNIEAVKRGYAAHLPFGKPQDSMIRWDVLEKAERGAHQSRRGLWAEPWAQSFYDFSAASGNRITFNTLANKQNMVKNTANMSLVSMMEAAQANGQYNTADRMAAAQLGKTYRFGADNVSPTMFSVSNAPHNNHLDEMLRDQADFMKTKGTGRLQDKFSHRGGYGRLDSYLALDTMDTTNSVWNRRKLRAFETYGTGDAMKRSRRARMAAAQRQINQQFGMSPINHHRM